jgi:hypothetical protein
MLDQSIRDTTIDFGKYRGQTFDEITNSGLDHDGLRYLDWLVGQKWLAKDKPALATALKTYLADPNVSRSLELALEE